jgi:hypothetical protein
MPLLLDRPRVYRRPAATTAALPPRSLIASFAFRPLPQRWMIPIDSLRAHLISVRDEPGAGDGFAALAMTTVAVMARSGATTPSQHATW